MPEGIEGCPAAFFLNIGNLTEVIDMALQEFKHGTLKMAGMPRLSAFRFLPLLLSSRIPFDRPVVWLFLELRCACRVGYTMDSSGRRCRSQVSRTSSRWPCLVDPLFLSVFAIISRCGFLDAR